VCICLLVVEVYGRFVCFCRGSVFMLVRSMRICLLCDVFGSWIVRFVVGWILGVKFIVMSLVFR